MSYLIVRPVKSRGIAALLVFLFWPLGMFYSTITGAFIMSFAIGPLVLWASLSSGLSLILLPLFFLVCLIWAIQAVNNHNRKILNEAAFYNKTINNQQTNRNIENSTANIVNKKLEFQRDLNQIKYLLKTNVINATQYQEQKVRIENKINDLDNNYEVKSDNQFEAIPAVKKSNTPIILGLLMIIIFILLSLYDSKTNSIKFDKISSIFFDKDSKEKEIIKTELEKTYFNVLNGKYTAQNFTGGVESSFYNTNVNTLMVMGLSPIATFTGNLKVEPSNIDVYEINEHNNTAKLKYNLRVITKKDTVNGNIEMDSKKIGGIWKFNADKFFQNKELIKPNEKTNPIVKKEKEIIDNASSYDDENPTYNSHDFKILSETYEDGTTKEFADKIISFSDYNITIKMDGVITQKWQIKKTDLEDEDQVYYLSNGDKIYALGETISLFVKKTNSTIQFNAELKQ